MINCTPVTIGHWLGIIGHLPVTTGPQLVTTGYLVEQVEPCSHDRLTEGCGNGGRPGGLGYRSPRGEHPNSKANVAATATPAAVEPKKFTSSFVSNKLVNTMA